MASTDWEWDGRRQKYYQYSANENAYVYQDGERLPMVPPSQSAGPSLMATSSIAPSVANIPWTWDATRHKYYIFSPTDNIYTYEDGSRVSSSSQEEEEESDLEHEEQDHVRSYGKSTQSPVHSTPYQGAIVQTGHTVGDPIMSATNAFDTNPIPNAATLKVKDFETQSSSIVTTTSSQTISGPNVISKTKDKIEAMEKKETEFVNSESGLRAYKSVAVAIIEWVDCDLRGGFKGELAGLEYLFSSTYRFPVDRIKIPNATKTMTPSDFLRKELKSFYSTLAAKSTPSLAILVYAGHGGPSKSDSSQLNWSGSSTSGRLNWTKTRPEPPCDQLLILDCCHAGLAKLPPPAPAPAFTEDLLAAADEMSTSLSGNYNFTIALLEISQQMNEKYLKNHPDAPEPKTFTSNSLFERVGLHYNMNNKDNWQTDFGTMTYSDKCKGCTKGPPEPHSITRHRAYLKRQPVFSSSRDGQGMSRYRIEALE